MLLQSMGVIITRVCTHESESGRNHSAGETEPGDQNGHASKFLAWTSDTINFENARHHQKPDWKVKDYRVKWRQERTPLKDLLRCDPTLCHRNSRHGQYCSKQEN